MKKILSFFLLVLSFNYQAIASDGQTVGCFDMAVTMPKYFTMTGPEGEVIVKTKSKLCVEEKHMTSDDETQVRTGDITIKIQDGWHKPAATYFFSAAFSEGAAGTNYTTYGKTAGDVTAEQTPDIKMKVLIFRMRNDHIKPGEIAGRVEVNGNDVTLLQK